MTTAEKKPTLALALSGGAARCIAHIGVIEALEDAGIAIDAIAGTSGGSLIGALYLDGMSTSEMAKVAARTGWTKLFTPTIPRTGLISSAGIYKFIKTHLRSRYIGDLPKPFAAVCADMVTGEKVVLTKGELARAVQASCSLPIIFTPTEIGGRLLIDGGYVSLIPVAAAREELNVRVVVGVDVNYRASGTPVLTSLPKIAMHLAHNIARRNGEAELALAEFSIRVDIDGIELYDIQKHEELLSRGRKAAKAALTELRQTLGTH
jgi:NTE family protein